MTTYIHETREAWLNAFVTEARPLFEDTGYALPELIRVSVGFTSSGNRGKVIGECWSNIASDSGHFEIFIRPSEAETARVADILTHELVHAAVGLEARHGRHFKDCATALGLEGKMTSTVAGEGWYKWALPVLDRLGPIPAAKLNSDAATSGRPKQKTYMLKLQCDDCGWTCRSTAAHVHGFAFLGCPVPDCDGGLRQAD